MGLLGSRDTLEFNWQWGNYIDLCKSPSQSKGSPLWISCEFLINGCYVLSLFLLYVFCFCTLEIISKTLFQLIVRIADGTLLLGKEDHVDFYHNLLTLKVKSKVELEVIDLRSRQAGIVDGMEVISLGRSFFTSTLYDSIGKLYEERPNFGCDELLSSSCGIREVFTLFLFSIVGKVMWNKIFISFLSILLFGYYLNDFSLLFLGVSLLCRRESIMAISWN